MGCGCWACSSSCRVFALYAETLPGGATHTLIALRSVHTVSPRRCCRSHSAGPRQMGAQAEIYSGLAIFAVGASSPHGAPDNRVGDRRPLPAGRRRHLGSGHRAWRRTSRVTRCARAPWRSSASPSPSPSPRRWIAGPLLKAGWGVPGNFALTGVLALCAMAVVRFAVPDPVRVSTDRTVARGQLARVLRDPQLLRLNIRHVRPARSADGALHAGSVRTARRGPRCRAPLDRLPAGAPALDPDHDPIRPAGGPARARQAAHQWAPLRYCWRPRSPSCFHCSRSRRSASSSRCSSPALNLLEAILPALVSKCASLEARGAAIGVNASMQFLGAFVGAAAGGWLSRTRGRCIGLHSLAWCCRGVWLLATATMAAPRARFGTNYSMGET